MSSLHDELMIAFFPVFINYFYRTPEGGDIPALLQQFVCSILEFSTMKNELFSTQLLYHTLGKSTTKLLRLKALSRRNVYFGYWVVHGSQSCVHLLLQTRLSLEKPNEKATILDLI